MAKAIQQFACEFCSKSFKTENGAEKHEKNCTKNPNSLEMKAQKVRREMDAEIEDIRLNATSPQHLIQLLESFLLTKGLKLTLNEYPSRFNLSVSNSHNSPIGYKQNWCGRGDAEGIPRGYPGWTGSWDGSIEIIDPTILNLGKKSYITMGDLSGRWSSDAMRIPWLQTGGGGSRGNNGFNYSGMIWLYDFPKMYDEFKMNGGELEDIECQYTQLLEAQHKSFKKERDQFIKSDNEHYNITRLIKDLQENSTKLKQVLSAKEKQLIDLYNKENAYILSPPPSAFTNNTKIMQIHTDLTSMANKVPDDNNRLIKEIERLNKMAETYIIDNPEVFI